MRHTPDAIANEVRGIKQRIASLAVPVAEFEPLIVFSSV
jgi:hypothetical protein